MPIKHAAQYVVKPPQKQYTGHELSYDPVYTDRNKTKCVPPGQGVGHPGSGQTANQKPPYLGPGGSGEQQMTFKVCS